MLKKFVQFKDEPPEIIVYSQGDAIVPRKREHQPQPLVRAKRIKAQNNGPI